QEPARITQMVAETRKLPSYRGRPIVFNEDDHFDFGKPQNNMLAALRAYSSWGYFDYRMTGERFDDGYQSVPVNWTISSPRKREFFALLSKVTGVGQVVDLLVKHGAKPQPAALAPPLTPAPAASPRAAVERALPGLQRSDVTFFRKAGCVSCHHNTLTAMAVARARTRGLPVDEQAAQGQKEAIGRFVASWRDRLLQGIGIPGEHDTVSYILLGLSAEGYGADEATDA